MSFLQEIGPDTLIPCFSVNIRENTDVKVTNDIVNAMFNDLCHTSADESEQRIPMIVTSSTMADHRCSATLEHFKQRLGVRRVKPYHCIIFVSSYFNTQDRNVINQYHGYLSPFQGFF